MKETLNQAAQRLHALVWKRFIRLPYGHVLDYAGYGGENLYPTAAQCEADFPNPLGWWTCIENGAFFGGLYAGLLAEKYQKQPDEETKREIRTLLRGLFLLQDVSPVDGFIARGVADDGKSHYKLSSEDQVGPWVYGLWRVLESGAADQALCGEIRAHLLREINGLNRGGFAIPTEWGNFTWGSLAGGDFRGCAKLLGCVCAAYAASGDGEWLRLYERLAAERPDGVYTRLEICAHGCAPDMVRNPGLVQFWIFACAQEFLHVLATKDCASGEAFRRGLSGCAATAVRFLDDYKAFLAAPKYSFDIDWTKLGSLWRKTDTPTDGMNMALEQNRYWMRELVPARHAEHNLLGNALFACLICARAPERAVREQTARIFSDILDAVDWESLHLSYAFAAECVCYALF
ncbi:MAG: hypothetical protein ACI4RV_02275 [Eubacteriales bacterium]